MSWSTAVLLYWFNLGVQRRGTCYKTLQEDTGGDANTGGGGGGSKSQ